MISAVFMGLVSVALIATWTDVRRRVIPNRLTVGGGVAALGLRALEGGGVAFVAGLLGLVIALLLALPLFVAGAMGGGDVKLLAAVGAFLGTERLVIGLLAIAVAGGIVALTEAARRGRLIETLGHAARLPGRLVRDRGKQARTIDSPDVLTIPYAVPIGVGAVAGWLLEGVV